MKHVSEKVASSIYRCHAGQRPGSGKLLLGPNDDIAVEQKKRLWVRIVTAADKADPAYERLLTEVLEVQSERVWRANMTAREQARGFLATTWTVHELDDLMDEGAWLATAVDKETGQLQGYALISPIHHLPPGEFVPVEDSPIRSRFELMDKIRFQYAYQLAVRTKRTLRRLQISAGIFDALVAENSRRSVNVVNCVLETPVCNER
ncbi:MAG: hypothetical protein ABSB95_11120, partial [Dissulfurispiraceae bacterium]